MHIDWLGLAFGLAFAPFVGEDPKQFFFLRIHRNDRPSRTLKCFHATVDITKLGITIGCDSN
jgi:hypothetical protein